MTPFQSAQPGQSSNGFGFNNFGQTQAGTSVDQVTDVIILFLDANSSIIYIHGLKLIQLEMLVGWDFLVKATSGNRMVFLTSLLARLLFPLFLDSLFI